MPRSKTSGAGAWWDRNAARVLVGAIGACVVAWAVAMAALNRAGAEPGWWPGLDPGSPEVVAEAEKLERAFANQVSMMRDPTDGADGSADWRVRIGADSANAWLAVRLRAWVESEGVAWPEDVRQVRAGFDGERVALGIRTARGGVVWAEVTPEVRRDGSVWLRAHGARVGRLPVPWSWAMDGLERELAVHAPEAAGTLRSVLAGREPLLIEPVVRLPDGRRVRIVELRGVGDGVGLAMRTERAAAP